MPVRVVADTSRTGAAVRVSAADPPAPWLGISRCSAALSGSSVAARASAATSGSSNTRSITKSPVVERHITSANQLITMRGNRVRRCIMTASIERRVYAVNCHPGCHDPEPKKTLHTYIPACSPAYSKPLSFSDSPFPLTAELVRVSHVMKGLTSRWCRVDTVGLFVAAGSAES